MKNILITFRKLSREKASTVLGIIGLIAGLICVMYIFLWITDEVGYDRFHKNGKNIFVVHAYLEEGSGSMPFRGCPPMVAPTLKAEFPEVENSSRYFPAYMESLTTYKDQKAIQKTAFSDFSFFDIFSFSFIQGGKGDEGVRNRVVLTETAAKRLFGNFNAVGEIIRVDNRFDLVVAGIIKDIPQNSSIAFDILLPIEQLANFWGNDNPNFLNTWYNNAFTTYGLLNAPESFDKIASGITNRIQKELPQSTNYLRAYRFEDGYLFESKNIRNVKIFILVGILVLLAATLNFIILKTAQTAKQVKETGLRKAIGASRWGLIRLIYSDIAIICFLAFMVSLLLVFIGLPVFNQMAGKNISITVLLKFIPLASLFAVYLITVLLSGSYPALFLSSFSPGQAFNPTHRRVKNKSIFRNAMVVSQFLLAIILLTSTFVITKQTRFLQQMDLGLQKDELFYIRLDGQLKPKAKTLKEELLRLPEINSAAIVSMLPTGIGSNGEGWNWEGKDPNFRPLITNWNGDEDLLSTFGIKLNEGDMFTHQRPGILINKTFADIIGWDNFSGKSINGYGTDYQIVGVINDFHFNDLSTTIKPLVIYPIDDNSRSWNYLMVNMNMSNIEKTLAGIQSICRELEPTYPLHTAFLDDDYNKLVTSEMNLQKLTGIFSMFALVVLCLGLWGVILFLTEQKTKEIGIRKCMGETVTSITGRFLWPVLLSGLSAFVIAVPVAWYAMDKWLENFAYKTSLSWWIFALAGLLALGISLLTVSWQSWKAATRNPVEALRYE
jgi:putative ABC transport system permease protein